jgi:hypothetical protein
MAASSPIGPPPDPLAPANFSEWLERVVGVVRRSFSKLVIIQIGISIVSAIIAAIITAIGASLPWNAYSPSGFPTGFMLVLILLGILIDLLVTICAQIASFYIAILDAASEPAGISTALRLAARPTLPMLGWSLVAGIMNIVGLLLFLIPGIYLFIVFYASLIGVVAIEHKGIGRTFRLVNPRFWPTAGRVLFAFLIFAISVVVVIGISYALGPDSIAASILTWVFSILIGLVAIAISVVTYTELRFHENPSTLTPTLAAEIRRSGG